MPESSNSRSNSHVSPTDSLPEAKNVIVEKVDQSDKMSRLSRQPSWLRQTDKMSFTDIFND